jgi:hypothetical protein
MKKLSQLLKESQDLDYRRMNVGEEEGQGMTKEEKRAFVEAVAAYRQLGEMISHKGNLSEIHESIKGIVENANNITLKETGDWFDRVTVQRHMKSMNESFKIFSNTIKEVSTLQQRLESSYDEIGEVLGKYYEIKEGNEFGAERAKAIAAGEDSFEVDGKSYKVTGVDAEDKENAKDFANESMKLTSLIKRNEELTGGQKELDVDGDGDIEADDLADLRAGKKADESVNEEEIRWNAVENAIINFLKVNTKILDKRVQAKDTDGVKGGLKSIISGLTNAQRSLKLESVNEASYVSGYTVKAKTPYEFVNGAYAVLNAYLRDEELGPKGKKELQDVLKSLEYMRKYFFFKLSESTESVNEITLSQALKSVSKGETSSVEGIKMSRTLANAIANWAMSSPYGMKYGKAMLKAPIGASWKMILSPNFGVEKYLSRWDKAQLQKVKPELDAAKKKLGL